MTFDLYSTSALTFQTNFVFYIETPTENVPLLVDFELNDRYTISWTARSGQVFVAHDYCCCFVCLFVCFVVYIGLLNKRPVACLALMSLS